VSTTSLVPVTLSFLPTMPLTGTVRFTADENVRFWMDEQRTVPQPLPAEWIIGQDPLPLMLYMEGVTASPQPEDTTVTLSWSDAGLTAQDTVKVTVGAITGPEVYLGVGESFARTISPTYSLENLHAGAQFVPAIPGYLQEPLPTQPNGDVELIGTCAGTTSVTALINGAELGSFLVHVVEGDAVMQNLWGASEIDPGAIIGVNGDDDNGDQVPDYTTGQTGFWDDELVPVDLYAYPWGLMSGTVTLTRSGTDANKIVLWADQAKTAVIPQEWTLPLAFPTTVYVEGCEATGYQTAGLQLIYKDPGNAARHEDTITVTVATVAFKRDAQGPYLSEVYLKVGETAMLISPVMPDAVWDQVEFISTNWGVIQSPVKDPVLRQITITGTMPGMTDVLAVVGEQTVGRIRVYVVSIDAQMQGVDDSLEEDPGARIPANDDDDNWNDVADAGEAPMPWPDDELLPVTLSLSPMWELTAGTVEVSLAGADAAKTKLWLDACKLADSPLTWSVQQSSPFLVTVYLEGKEPTGLRTVTLKVCYKDPSGQEIDADRITVTVYAVDIDVDSDNTNGYSTPDGSTQEDAIEEDNLNFRQIGKIVAVNSDDSNGNGKPDFADTTIALPEKQFVPVQITLPAPIDPTMATLTLSYHASDPAGVQEAGGSWLPADGTFRLWKVNADNANRTGQYLAPSSYTATALGFTAQERTKPYYLEAVRPSDPYNPDYRVMTVEVDPVTAYPLTTVCRDKVRVTAMLVDMDVDSDNTDSWGYPMRTDYEDLIEDRADLTGRIVIVNDGDKDRDGVPDFADGFNADGIIGNADDSNPSETFTPVVIEIPAPVDLAIAKLKFTYPASDPAACTPTGHATYSLPQDGFLRLWATPNGRTGHGRGKANIADGGDYIAPGTYAATDLGFTNEIRTLTVYLEGVTAKEVRGNLRLIVEVDPDGEAGPMSLTNDEDVNIVDAVRVTLQHAQLPAWGNASPTDGGVPTTGGPTDGINPDLATGNLVYSTGADILAYNPEGLSVAFGRAYFANQATQGYGSPGLSPGWVHSYDVYVKDDYGMMVLCSPNGAQEALPPVSGAPYLASLTPGTSVTLTFANKSTLTFEPWQMNPNIYLLKRATNRLGQSVDLEWDASRRLVRIYDTARTLLTFQYTAGLLTGVTWPAGGNAVVSYGYDTNGDLKTVTAAGASKARGNYGYTTVGNARLLNSFTIPHPGDASKNSKATVKYYPVGDPYAGRVESVKYNEVLEDGTVTPHYRRFIYEPFATKAEVRETEQATTPVTWEKHHFDGMRRLVSLEVPGC